MSKFDLKTEEDLTQNLASVQQNVAVSNQLSNKITFDQIASVLLKQNYILTALEFHTELAESGRELPRLRDYFSNPANFEQSQIPNNTNNTAGSLSSTGFFPLHKASSIQTFDSLDLTRYSDDVDQNKFQDDKIAVLEFELRKAKETINQLRATLTLATENQGSNMSKSSLNGNLMEQFDKPILESNSNNNSKTNLTKNIIFDIAETEDDDDQDDTELKSSKNSNKLNSIKKLMPHDKNAINFLINEYLLQNDYKMTSVTFAEENESQDLEDWDVVGLNRAKPPNLYQLYKLYLNKTKYTEAKKEAQIKKESEIKNKIENSTQTELSYETTSTNTDSINILDFESQVNFDRETFDNQKIQIKNLLEKQEILLKSIAKFESEISTLNSERESNLKKIDLLTVSLEKAKKLTESQKNSLENGQLEKENLTKKDSIDEEIISNHVDERKIPIVFKEILNKYSSLEISESNQFIVDEMSSLKLDSNFLLSLLFKNLPKLTRYVHVDKRLELLPLILASAIQEQEELTHKNSKKNSELINLLFNLIENPNAEQRAMILQACIQYTKYTGPIYVNNYLLPQCWEQLNDKIDERRILVAEACSVLAPYIYNDIRSSLMFSILKQLIQQETVETVKISAIKSLSILINHISDENKFQQCIELLDLCVQDSSDLVLCQVEELLMPSLSLWSLTINKFSDVLIMHLLDKTEFYVTNSTRIKYRRTDELKNYEKNACSYLRLLNLNIQFVFAYVLIHFREANSEDELKLMDKKIPKLNSFFHSLKEKLDINLDLYKIDSILEDYLSLTTKYLNIIESDLWSSIELSKAFEWLSDSFIRKLIQMSAQVDACDELCPYLVKLFRNFTLLFAIDFELVKSKIIPIFEKLLNVPDYELDSTQQSALEQSLSNKTCPLYKSTLPVYFVGILSTLVDIELYGWFNLNANLTNDQDDAFLLKSESSPSSNTREKVIRSSTSKNSVSKKHDNDTSLNESQTSLDKRIDHMNNYLKNVFFALSLNQNNLDGVIAIYEQMKLKSKTSDYVIQMLLSTLWDGIVHISLYVRCNTAKLFEILVTDCNEYLLSTRILPALITLANDLDKMVRCSSISPLTSIIENCENKEILERVYTQLQSFLSDPILKDEYLLQIELLRTFRRISTKVNSKFREEFILPYLTILTMNVKNIINENDYEFTLSEVTATFLTFSSQSPVSLSASSSNSSLSSSYSNLKENQFQMHQNQQQDIIKLCVLLYDTYQSICFSSEDNQKPLVISRQSIQESLLPGLSSLREIFHNCIIINTNTISSNSLSNNQNDYVKELDAMIHKIESIQNNITNSNDVNSSPLNTPNLGQVYLSPSPSLKLKNNFNEKVSPLKVSPGALISDFVNMGSNALSSSSASSFSSTSTVTSVTNQQQHNSVNENSTNGNLKSFVFKGFSQFKDQSKDKLSNFLLTNKSYKK
ncbi:unnamed protein product [Brachionus calyciflorus]|uniref:LisH domain-containing protein n=1 Tax=Brachionus calyciflorus TaxID=104777 RepID=A0A813S850_9BILA|nr:unnamed protein product [Brachionus calyciflorus]